MPKKLNRLEDYISAHDAAQLLSLKMHRPIQPQYIRQLAKSKKQSVRTQSKGSHYQLYNRDDILACTVRQKKASSTP